MTFNRLLKQGLIISFISQYSSVLIQLIVGMVLARLLTPAEFGIFAIIMVFTAFFSLMSDIGIAPAVIQSKTLNPRDVLNYFYVSIALGIGLSALFVALSFVLVQFYDNQVYVQLGYWLTITILFSSLRIIPTALLSKEKQFKSLGILRFTAALLSGVVAIVMAYQHFSYYSLVAQSIVYAVVLFVGAFVASKFVQYLRPFKTNLKSMMDSIKKIVSYSSYNFAFNFINYFSRNLDNILIGKYMGASSLGFYDKAYRLMLFPVSSLNQVFSPIIHPLLADYEDNKEFIYQAFAKMVQFLSLVGIPLTVFFYFNAEDIIMAMYGHQWVASAPIFRILSLTVWIQIIVASLGAIFLASNKPNLYFYNGLMNAVILVTAIVIGILHADLVQLSYYLMVAYYVSAMVTLYLIMVHVFDKQLMLLFKLLSKPLLIGVVVMACLQVQLLISVDHIFVRLGMQTVLALLGFVLGLWATGEYRFVMRVIKNN